MGYYMRMVRTMAYVGELFFFESYKDVWNPVKTSKKPGNMACKTANIIN